jgi:hypothetical protein
VKLGIIFPALLLLGCGGGTTVEVTNPHAVMEAGDHNPPGGLCCQVGNSTIQYECSQMADAELPWVCNVSPKTGDCAENSGYECLTCQQTACVVGMACVADIGKGTVLPCNQKEASVPYPESHDIQYM